MKNRIKALVKLGNYISSNKEEMDELVQSAVHKNQWFVEEFVRQALEAVNDQFLREVKLLEWVSHYNIVNGNKKLNVGIIMAGNLPLVGFHDWLCCFISGHDTLVKLSSKDDVLLKYLVAKIYELETSDLPKTEFVERLKGFDAVIATGTNNSALHFEHYFKKYRHIIRRNRTSIAVLDGTESRAELIAFGHDIFDYFGMGCRNVSKVFLPEGYDFSLLQEVLEQEFSLILQHHKYRNNYDYNYTIFLMNQTPHKAFSSIILLEREETFSRMASLHYEYYSDLNMVMNKINNQALNIQCLVSNSSGIEGEKFSLGQAQFPELLNYADGVDTMAFLEGL